MSVNISEILSLSVPEKILLVETIWDSIPVEGKEYEMSAEQIKILEEELQSYGKNPKEGSSWEEVKTRVTQKL